MSVFMGRHSLPCGAALVMAGALMLGVVPGSAVEGVAREIVLHDFTGGNDGGDPATTLLVGSDGTLYGTAGTGNVTGSTNCCGVVFAETPPATARGAYTFNVLYTFQGGTDGDLPTGNLVAGPFGALYGATLFGGAFGYGAVFSLTPPSVAGGAWTEQAIYSFTNGADGAVPYRNDLTPAPGGGLYGMTSGSSSTNRCGGPGGCGSAFLLTPPAAAGGAWTETTLHTFTGPDGANPTGGLVAGPGGVLYGNTREGGTRGCAAGDGAKLGCGTVFSLTPPAVAGGAWTPTTLFAFPNGSAPALPDRSPVLTSDGALILAASAGGAGHSPTYGGCGAVLRLSSSGGGAWTEQVLHLFSAPGAAGRHGTTYESDGCFPAGDLQLAPDGSVYGTTYGGGYFCPICAGTVFHLVPPASGSGFWKESQLYAFQGGADGSGAGESAVFGPNRTLVGVTSGTSGTYTSAGTVFQVTLPPSASGP